MAVSSGCPVDYGVNSIRYSRQQAYCGTSVHAEVDLVKSLGARAKNAKIFVYRFNSRDTNECREPHSSIPCNLCQHALKEAGISRVYSLNEEGALVTMKKSDLNSFSVDPFLLSANIAKDNRMLTSQLNRHLVFANGT